MVITFKELKFKNILSFGAKEKTITFTKGINLISGKNGSGKSAILDAISFCLFGKPYRNVKIKDLINRKNKKDTSVTCSFTIDNKDLIEIKRTLNPDSLEIKRNNSEIDVLSSKKLNQEELNKIIGIDYNLFKQVISLAVNYNKPFLSLESKDKRAIIEQIFNITIFGLMLKEAKRRNADNTVKNELNINSIQILKENLKTLKTNREDIIQANKDFEKNKETEIKAIDERIQKYEENINNINIFINEIINQINAISIDSTNIQISEIKTKLEQTTKNINNKEYSVENNTKTIENLEVDVICPRCLTKLTQEHKEKETQKLDTETILLKEQLWVLRNNQKELKDCLEKLQTLKQTYDKLETNKQSTTEKRILLETELSHLKETRQNILNRKIEIDIESLTKNYNEKVNEYKTVLNNAKTIKSIIDNYETVFGILSESGIKAFFFQKLIPILNTKVNEYLQLFEMPIVLLFDDFMNEKITNCENMKNDVSYYSYSEDEKKRIDMAILLSFISMTKAISNWNCNLLLIDELLDGAIDESGLDKLVTSLKNMTYESNLCIYIISHRLQQDYNSKFNSCLHVEKEDSFSKITYI